MNFLEIKNSRNEKLNIISQEVEQKVEEIKKIRKESKNKRLVQEVQPVNNRSSRERGRVGGGREEKTRQNGVNHK